MDLILIVNLVHVVNHRTQLTVGTQVNAIRLDVASLIIAVRVMNWLENPSVSVKQPVTGHQRRCQHVCVSKFNPNSIRNKFEYVFDLC